MVKANIAALPARERERISSTFDALCRAHLGTPGASIPYHDRGIADVWALSGGDPDKYRAAMERAVRDAASMGIRDLSLPDVVSRWRAAESRAPGRQVRRLPPKELKPRPLDACPPEAEREIRAVFTRLCRAHLGKEPSSGHPIAARLIWRMSGGRLGNALAGLERVVLRAAAMGGRAFALDLGTVASRLASERGVPGQSLRRRAVGA